MRRILWGLVAAMAIEIGLTGTTVAQGFNPFPPPTGGGIVQRDNPAGATLTADGLHTMLAQMGLTPEGKTDSDGGRYEKVTIKKNDFTVPLTICLSKDGRKVWLQAFLGSLPEGNAVSAGVLLKLLQENQQMASQFCCSEDGKDLWLKRHFDNRGVAADVVRQELDMVVTQVIDTKLLWQAATSLVAAPPATAAAPAPWEMYTSVEGRFRALMPGKPTTGVQDVPGENARLYMHGVEYRGNHYCVGYVDFPAPAVSGVPAELAYDRVRDGMLRAAGTRLVRERAVTRNGIQGRELTLETDGRTVEWQYLLVGQRLYMIGVQSGRDNADVNDVRRFCDSFHVTK
jgi:hypothetical protein